MKAVKIYEPGGPEQLIVEELPIPTIKEGWSLVKVMGFGINHSEVFTRKGLSPSVQFPRILGIECVGVIEESNTYQKGQQVVSIMGGLGRAYDGGYSEYALIPDDNIYTINSSLSWEEITAIPETYYTAYLSLNNLHINKEDKILVRGGTSGVGIAFMKLVKGQYPNISITATTRLLSKKQDLLDLGYSNVIVDKENILQTKESYDKILDLIGPAAIVDTFKHMNKYAIVCITGLLGNVWSFDFDPLVQMKSSTYLTVAESTNVDQEAMSDLFDYIEKYHIDVTPHKVYTIDQIQEAHKYIDQNKTLGKIIVLNKENIDE